MLGHGKTTIHCHMGSEGYHTRADRVDVEVMAILNAIDAANMFANIIEVDFVGGGLHQNSDRCAEERECARNHQRNDKQGRDRVSAHPPRR